MEKPQVRTHFKTQEGKYVLHSERNNGLIPFDSRRGTRLAYACISSGSEAGEYILFNVGEAVHISRLTAVDQEPIRTVVLAGGPNKTWPTCLTYCQTKDGGHLVVGMHSGEVMLMSLRAILQSPMPSCKPNPTATFNPDGNQDGSRCNAVIWAPKSEGTHLVVAYQSGNIYTYKQLRGWGSSAEGGSKFSMSLSANKTTNPTHVFTMPAAVHDLAFSPDGAKLAAGCRDGVLRILDPITGSVLSGFKSYYGAVLCCAFSSDGRFVAAGGEDDCVAVYGNSERQVMAWCSGHSSFVSCVSFDPWLPVAPSRVGVGDLGVVERLYRLGSGGQDAALCLWDLVLEEEEEQPSTPTPSNNTFNSIKKVPSQSRLTSSAMELGKGGHNRTPSFGTGLADPSPSPHGSSAANGAGPAIAPVPPRTAMVFLPPVMQHKLHIEPISDVLFTKDAIFTACFSGQVKCWLRPHVQKAGAPL